MVIVIYTGPVRILLILLNEILYVLLSIRFRTEIKVEIANVMKLNIYK